MCIDQAPHVSPCPSARPLEGVISSRRMGLCSGHCPPLYWQRYTVSTALDFRIPTRSTSTTIRTQNMIRPVASRRNSPSAMMTAPRQASETRLPAIRRVIQAFAFVRCTAGLKRFAIGRRRIRCEISRPNDGAARTPNWSV